MNPNIGQIVSSVKNKKIRHYPIYTKDKMSYDNGMDINSKILSLLEEKGLKKKTFADRIGINDAYFRRLLKGSQRWNIDNLEKVAKGLNIPLFTLFGGEKKEFTPPPPVIKLPHQFKEIPNDVQPEDYVFVPMISGEIAAGCEGRIMEEYVEHLICVYQPALGKRSTDSLSGVMLAKDARSMEPTLRPGDIVIIDHSDRPPFKSIPKKGEKNIYAINLDAEGHCTIKRVVEHDDHWILISDNPDYHPLVLHKSDQNPFIGRVIWSWTSWI